MLLLFRTKFAESFFFQKRRPIHYTRGITPHRPQSISVDQRLGNTETSQRWRAIGDKVRFDQAGNRTHDLPRR